jgi:hypothetical protein
LLEVFTALHADAREINKQQAMSSMNHLLQATNDTIHWGYFSKSVKPSLTIKSGETVTVEMVSVSVSELLSRR